MSSSPPISLHKDLNLCLDITCFCSPLPALRLIQFHPCVLSPPPSSSSSSQCSSSLPFLDWFPCLLFFHSLSFPLSHSSSFVSLNLHEHWYFFLFFFAWLVLLEPLCQQHRSFKELFMLHQTRNKTSHRSSRWFSDGHVYPCFHKERIVEDCKVSGFLEQLNTIFLTKGQVWIDVEIPVRARKTRWTIFVDSYGVGITTLTALVSLLDFWKCFGVICFPLKHARQAFWWNLEPT